MLFPLLFRALTGLFALLLIAGCASQEGLPGAALDGPTACETPRPQVCTMIYAPVCARHSDATLETHASACNACADDTVAAFSDGPCAQGSDS
ncbi:MAG: hypothetical protein ACI87W_001061 [Halieaceae bacterium]|jgi:hypothetical protein